MKLAFMNNWIDGKRYWATYLFKKPFIYEKTPAWMKISLFGLVMFIY